MHYKEIKKKHSSDLLPLVKGPFAIKKKITMMVEKTQFIELAGLVSWLASN